MKPRVNLLEKAKNHHNSVILVDLQQLFSTSVMALILILTVLFFDLKQQSFNNQPTFKNFVLNKINQSFSSVFFYEEDTIILFVVLVWLFVSQFFLIFYNYYFFINLEIAYYKKLLFMSAGWLFFVGLVIAVSWYMYLRKSYFDHLKMNIIAQIEAPLNFPINLKKLSPTKKINPNRLFITSLFNSNGSRKSNIYEELAI